MRILIDALVAQAHPELPALPTVDHRVASLRVFNPFASAVEIVDLISDFVPDLTVIDPAWLVISTALTAVIKLTGTRTDRCIVASRSVDNVLKIKTAHGGFFDVLNLTQDLESIVTQLENDHHGISQLDSDRLWANIDRPRSHSDMADVPRDESDLAILELVRIGLTDGAIAESIHMSQQTVRNRVSAMLARSGLTNRTQMAWAFTNQILTEQIMENMNAHK